MDAILQFLIDWGYWGSFSRLFYSRKCSPFSSEAVLAACVGPLGLDPVISITAATAGNVAGGMTCYWMGHLGNMEWIEKYFHVKKRRWTVRSGLYTDGVPGWLSSPLSYFGKCHIHCIGHDACQYMDCHSRYDHRKDTPLRLIGMGSIGSLRFNALNYETGTNSRWKLYPLCTRTGRTLSFGERGTDGVTTYFYRNGIKAFYRFRAPHSGDRTRNRLNAFLTLLSAEETRRKVHYTGIERYPLAEETLKQLDYPRLIGKQHEEDYYAIHRRPGTQKQRYPLGSHYIKLKMILPGFSTRRKAAVPPFPYTISSTLMPSLPKNNPKCGNNLFSILYTRY